MALTEEEVYNGAKRWFRKNGYVVLAGQPARGVDHLPVIEIKRPSGDKGSRDAYKPDLVVFKDGLFYIVECKPEFNEGDRKKITDVLNSPDRLRNFYIELEQYQLIAKVNFAGTIQEFNSSVKGILAYSGIMGQNCEHQHLIVKDWKGEANLI